MTTATDVASYINAQGMAPYMDNRKLQKLVYFSQAWALGWTGRPIFDSRFEAWPDGPVNRDLWVSQRYSVVPSYEGQLDDRQAEIVDAVLAHYAAMSSADLVDLSHEEVWTDARGELPASAPSQRPLDDQKLRNYYVRCAISGEGPRWVSSRTESDPAEVIETARQISARWKDGLDLLATK